MNTIDESFARDFLQRLHAAVKAHDAQALAALCCDDIRWEDPAAPATLHGRYAVLRFHRDIMFPALPDVHAELIDGPYLSLDRTGVAARLRIRGTMNGALTPPGFAPTGGMTMSSTPRMGQLAIVAPMLMSSRSGLLCLLDQVQGPCTKAAARQALYRGQGNDEPGGRDERNRSDGGQQVRLVDLLGKAACRGKRRRRQRLGEPQWPLSPNMPIPSDACAWIFVYQALRDPSAAAGVACHD